MYRYGILILMSLFILSLVKFGRKGSGMSYSLKLDRYGGSGCVTVVVVTDGGLVVVLLLLSSELL